MVTLRAIARDAVDLGKDTLAEAFERERMHAPQHFPIRFLNLLHSVPVHWGGASVTQEAVVCVGPRDVPAMSASQSKQDTPHFTREVIAGILKSSKGYKQMFCALLGGTGLRAGEAIGLEIDKHISEDFRTLYVRQKVWRTKLELFLKTDAGRRDVDLCPAVAAALKAYVGDRTSGFLFHNRKGNFLSQTNLLRRGLHPA
jgi:integrase